MKTPKATGRAPWASAALMAVTTASLHAAPFVYAPGDLVLTLRQSGAASDLVVNLGPATAFSTLAAGSTLALARVDPALVTATFPSLNGLTWHVAGANRPPLIDVFPIQTLWVTAPRLDPGEPATPWLRKGQSVQGNAGSQIDAVGKTAASYSSLAPAGPGNTATAVAIPLTSPFTLGPVLGPSTDFVANFQGSVAQLTAEDFDADPGNVSRADLFELLPGSTAAGTLNKPGRALGVFEFRPDGTLSFTAATAEVPPPANRRHPTRGRHVVHHLPQRCGGHVPAPQHQRRRAFHADLGMGCRGILRRQWRQPHPARLQRLRRTVLCHRSRPLGAFLPCCSKVQNPISHHEDPSFDRPVGPVPCHRHVGAGPG